MLETVNNSESLKNYLSNELYILHPNGLPLTLRIWVNYQKKYEFNPVHNHLEYLVLLFLFKYNI